MPTISEIQTCIDNLTANSEPIDYIVLAAETGKANTGIAFTVPTVDDLPDLYFSDMNDGQVIFVESIKVPVFNSNCKWKGIDGRILRDDIPEFQIWAWGCNGQFRLGDGTSVNKCSPVREISSSTNWCQVSSGYRHASAIKITGELWSWGENNNRQLGDGTTTDKCSPVREISSSTNWCQVSASFRNSFAVKTSGELWGWGDNGFAILGDGTTVSKCSPVQEISSSTNWCQVSGSQFHASAVKTSGEIWSWGVGEYGRLGDGTTVSKCSPVQEITSSTNWCQVSAGCQHTSAVKTTGEIWSWGIGSEGRLGNGATTNRCSPVREISSSTDWRQVSTYAPIVSALKTTGEIWSWGNNGFGRLGDGTETNKCSPVREISSSTNWCQVDTAADATSAVKITGEIWGWGFNSRGQLGDGSTTDKCSPVQEITSSTNWCQVSGGRSHMSAIKVIS